MCRYSEKNLIKYEEAIRLHFDWDGKTGWLTLKNYGLVFHKWPWANPWTDVKEITIGLPAGTFNKDECAAFVRLFGGTLDQANDLRPSPCTISISQWLDVFDVIRFQTLMLKAARYYFQGGKFWTDNREWNAAVIKPPLRLERLNLMIEDALTVLGCKRPKVPYQRVKNFEYEINKRLRGMLSSPPGVQWIAQQIRDNREGKIDLTAYFPQPLFIIEEQRTALTGDFPGKTHNSDSRSIKPIYSPAKNPILDLPKPAAARGDSGWSVNDSSQLFAQQLLDALDKDRAANEAIFLTRGKKIDALAPSRKDLVDKANFANSGAYLHKHLPRINCYGFRGDKRGPTSMRAAGGFLPGVTRTDKGVNRYKSFADRIEAALWQGPEAYAKVMKELDVLTLAVYTADANFKGYISTSTSTAIAKHFANAYATEANPFDSVYCYAMLCRNAFHLPTEVKGTWHKWHKERDAQNAFVHNAEQEVAVTGGIGWHQVSGMRVIRVDAKGQFFSGPVFMNDLLRQEYQDQLPKTFVQHGIEVKAALFVQPDNGAFDQLFELFSGKSQGPNPEIFWSYDAAPFDCPPALMTTREQTWRYRPETKDPAWPY